MLRARTRFFSVRFLCEFARIARSTEALGTRWRALEGCALRPCDWSFRRPSKGVPCDAARSLTVCHHVMALHTYRRTCRANGLLAALLNRTAPRGIPRGRDPQQSTHREARSTGAPDRRAQGADGQRERRLVCLAHVGPCAGCQAFAARAASPSQPARPRRSVGPNACHTVVHAALSELAEAL